jgi:hypothetical protein
MPVLSFVARKSLFLPSKRNFVLLQPSGLSTGRGVYKIKNRKAE